MLKNTGLPREGTRSPERMRVAHARLAQSADPRDLMQSLSIDSVHGPARLDNPELASRGRDRTVPPFAYRRPLLFRCPAFLRQILPTSCEFGRDSVSRAVRVRISPGACRQVVGGWVRSKPAAPPQRTTSSGCMAAFVARTHSGARANIAGAEGEAADSTRASPLRECELRRAAIG